MTYTNMEDVLKAELFYTENDTIKTMMSNVVTASVVKTKNTTLPKPVNFTLKHQRSSWSVDGCEATETNATHTVCTCAHLSTFALIMQTDKPPEDDSLLELITMVALSVGLACLALAILTFIFCTWNPKVNNTARLNLSICLFLAHLLLLLVQNTTHTHLINNITIYDLISYITIYDLISYITIYDLISYITIYDLSNYIITIYDLISYITIYDLISYITIYDLISYITIYDLIIYITIYDLISYITIYDLISYITICDLIIYITIYDLISYITIYDLISYITIVICDLIRYINIYDLTTYVSIYNIFVWMYLEALQLFLLVRRLRKVKVIHHESVHWGYLLLIGYGVPCLMVSVSAGLFPDGYGNEQCWLKTERGFKWSFLGPVCYILTMNIILFTGVIGSLQATLADLNREISLMRDTRVMVFKALVQFVILGCPWVLGFFVKNNKMLEYLFILSVSQQGTFIFLVHCVLNKEVRLQLPHSHSYTASLPVSSLYCRTCFLLNILSVFHLQHLIAHLCHLTCAQCH
ncbi:hypothetical protein JZ751_007477 [Albula glossodonta]|uniref:Uncharacterized protein n=1 Tax=Albula glossodonta TaxID=121402 RepID=A0A8T2N7E7_9TELE|nr:hypothetical protein JZ751_007477 [Albula glossodonta]